MNGINLIEDFFRAVMEESVKEREVERIRKSKL